MFLGIDLGTSSVKALLLDDSGQILNLATEAYALNSPQSGWAESHPQDWWDATCLAIKACLLPFKDRELESISFSGQMHGTVICDKDMNVIRPAILWADTRSTEQLKIYENLSEKDIQALANPIATGMMGPTLLWLKENELENYKEIFWALQPKDWLRYQFTTEVYTDPSDASATLLYDLAKDDWAFELIGRLGLRTDYLGPLQGSSSIAGYLNTKAAKALNLKAGIPIATGGGDAACSMYGTSLTTEGQAQINIGTAMQIFAISNKVSANLSPKTHLYRTVEDNYYAMAAMQNAGIAFEWLRKTFNLSWDELYKLAFNAPSGSDGLLFLPYLTGERTPHLNADAKGTWHGLTLQHEQKHMVRSVFEGVAFALKDGLLALEETGLDINHLRLAGGGTTQKLWQQLLADVLNKELHEIDAFSASAIGAARLAATAVDKTIPVSDLTPKHIIKPKTNETLDTAFKNFQQLYHSLY